MTEHIGRPVTSPTLTAEQEAAVEAVLEYFLQPAKRKLGKLWFGLGGFAGTGKTTVIKEIVRRVSYIERPDQDPLYNNVAICAFTGKAVSVLKKKGLGGARTLHSLMYRPIVDPKTEIVIGWTRKERLWDDIDEEPVDFIIVDEASMVSKDLYHDLLYYQKPILFVGDPGQLEPIGDNPNIMRQADVVLEKVHRQAEHNPIIKMATLARQGITYGFGGYNTTDGLSLRVLPKSAASKNLMLEVDQVITAYNNARKSINKELRQHYEFDKRSILVEGEKVICLRNNREDGVYNGQMFMVTKVWNVGEATLQADLFAEDGTPYRGMKMLTRGFGGGFDEKKERLPKGVNLFDYGYCITCHKSQGSEWDSVLVLEQYAPSNLWDMNRWRYTAITRAAKRLIYVR